MTLSNSSSEQPLHLTSSGALDTRLRGGWLVLAVQETMHPVHISLWLRPLPNRPDREVRS